MNYCNTNIDDKNNVQYIAIGACIGAVLILSHSLNLLQDPRRFNFVNKQYRVIARLYL